MLKGVANVPVVSAIQMRIVAQAVGKGMIPSVVIPGDVEFSNHLTSLVKAWSEDPDAFDAGGRLNLTDYQRLAVCCLLINGEIFTVHRQTGSYRYAVQAINAASVQGESLTTFTNSGFAPVAIHDGVALDSNGRAIAYSLADNTVIPAGQLSHTFDAAREANAYRGLPFAWTSVNSAIDLHEITFDATGSAKFQGRFSFFRTGRKNKVVKTKSNRGIQETGTLDADSPDGQALATDLSRVLGGGGAILDLGEGEDMKPLQLPAATDRTLTMMVVLAQRVCLAYGMAPDLILDPGKIGGTGIRAVLSQAEKSIYQLQAPVVRLTKTMITRFLAVISQPIGTEGEAGYLPYGLAGKPLPIAWERFIEIQLPSTITVDYGRDTKANIELLRMGLISEKDLQEAEGKRWEAVQDQWFLEVKRALEKCADMGIPYSMYRPLAGAAPVENAAVTTNTSAE